MPHSGWWRLLTLEFWTDQESAEALRSRRQNGTRQAVYRGSIDHDRAHVIWLVVLAAPVLALAAGAKEVLSGQHVGLGWMLIAVGVAAGVIVVRYLRRPVEPSDT